MAMSYGHVYVARIAFGAKDFQTVKAFQEAESYTGPSLLIAYSHCIAHGYDMAFGCEQQKLLVDSALWPLYRYDPRRALRGEPPLQLDSGAPKVPVEKFMQNESRFRMVEAADPVRYRHLTELAAREARRRLRLYKHLSDWRVDETPAGTAEATPAPTSSSQAAGAAAGK